MRVGKTANGDDVVMYTPEENERLHRTETELRAMCDELKLALKQTLVALGNAVDGTTLYDEFTSKAWALLHKYATDEDK